MFKLSNNHKMACERMRRLRLNPEYKEKENARKREKRAEKRRMSQLSVDSLSTSQNASTMEDSLTNGSYSSIGGPNNEMDNKNSFSMSFDHQSTFESPLSNEGFLISPATNPEYGEKENGQMEDLQFHKLSFQNSEMSLVNLQRVAIKEEMNDVENCNYEHLSKDDLINEVKAKDDRVRKLEAERNVLNSNMEKERVKTTVTINKQIDEIERLNRVNKELENRIQDLMRNASISNVEKERIRTTFTINKQIDEIERLNRVNKELENRIKDLMKSGIHQFTNEEYVKTGPIENDSGINDQEPSLPMVMQQQPQEEIQSLRNTPAEIINNISQSVLDMEAIKLQKSGSLQNAEAVSVQGMLGKEDVIQESLVSGPRYTAEVGNTNTEIKIASLKAEIGAFITRIMNLCVPELKYSDSLPLCAPSPKINVENQFQRSPDTTTESDSPREPLENNINLKDSYCKTRRVSTEDITTRSKKLRVPESNLEDEKHLYPSLDANVASGSLEGARGNYLDDNQSRITLTDAQRNRQNQALYVDPMTLSVPVCVPKPEHNPYELSELTSVSMEGDLPEVPIEVGNNSFLSNSKTFEQSVRVKPNSETLEDVPPKKPNSEMFEDVARKNSEGKFKNCSTWFKYSTEHKKDLQRTSLWKG